MSDEQVKTEIDPAVEEFLAKANDSQKDRLLAIFFALAQSERFNSFLETNFDIKDEVDHEAKTIVTRVEEKPAEPIKLNANQRLKLATVLTKYGVTQTKEATDAVMAVLGDDSPIQLVSSEDLVKNLKEKL